MRRGNFLEPEGKDVVTLYARSGKKLAAGPHFIRHDPEKIGRALMRNLRSGKK